MEDIYVNVQDLSVGYNKKALIKNIAFNLKKGEILTLIGPNGSGKSTILKSLTRHLEALSGTAFIGREDVFLMPEKTLAKKLSVVLTERIRGEMLSCADVVETGRYPYTGRLGILSQEDKKIVSDALKTVGVWELRDRDFSALSDGQRQRVLLARALAGEPEIIVLDEPTSFLDVRHKIALLTLLRHMAENGITVIMSLHEIDLAQKVSDKVMCVKGEAISHFGPPEEIFQEKIINALYDLDNGSYDVNFGSLEFPGAQGEAKVFVLSACGSGIPVFRALQKAGLPFVSGILFENDIDLVVAEKTAQKVFTCPPFQTIPETTLLAAEEAIRRLPYVIDAGMPIGETNRDLLKLRQAAEGKIVTVSDLTKRKKEGIL